MENIFEFLNENNNDNLSSIKNLDIKELLLRLKNYNLKLRRKLFIPDNQTFGMEIEFEFDNPSMVGLTDYDLKTYIGNIDVKPDASLDKGGEVATDILNDEYEKYYLIKMICEIIKNNNGKSTSKTGAHIHIGVNSIGNNGNKWFEFLITWIAYENTLIRFFNGEYYIPRIHMFKYAKPLGYRMLKNIEENKELFLYYLDPAFIRSLNYINEDKYMILQKFNAVNFDNISDNIDDYIYGNTIELRSPNGTLNPIIWQNNLNVFTKFINKFGSINMDIVYNRLKKNYYNIENYIYTNKIDIEEALEFADLIFDNNLDKLYFLRQYFKDYQEEEIFKKTKSFTE